jgi:hypothetical protein
MANDILTNISQDEAERARAISRQKFLWDLEHNTNAARKESRAAYVALLLRKHCA